MIARPSAPVERVRSRLAQTAGSELAAAMPAGYHRLGRVLLIRLPSRLRPHFSTIGAAWQEVLGVETVLTQVGPIEGEMRRPRVEIIAGGPTITEVREHGIRYRLDASEIMFATGNRNERFRAGQVTRAGEHVIDLFAGIGYFAIPAAKFGKAQEVLAVEKNPIAARYLSANVSLNGVADRVHPLIGDNRTAPLPLHGADRVFLGYLPSALPWIPRALSLLRIEGGWLHVHLVEDVRGGTARACDQVGRAVSAAGGVIQSIDGREVKPYGPGRTHLVVDVEVRPTDAVPAGVPRPFRENGR
ncbi:MAG: 50S ribosomal protein L11 methyltransferase [Thermoplasmata archaeon]